jgi:ketosteroid isomerase-like protein
MSREAERELERFYAAFNAGEVEPLRAFAHSDFVYRTRDEMPGGGSYGLDDALARISALREIFDEIRWEPQEFIDAGERVVVVVRQVARGRTSGVRTDQPISHVWLVEDDRARELRVFSQRREALEAVGLRK